MNEMKNSTYGNLGPVFFEDFELSECFYDCYKYHREPDEKPEECFERMLDDCQKIGVTFNLPEFLGGNLFLLASRISQAKHPGSGLGNVITIHAAIVMSLVKDWHKRKETTFGMLMEGGASYSDESYGGFCAI